MRLIILIKLVSDRAVDKLLILKIKDYSDIE